MRPSLRLPPDFLIPAWASVRRSPFANRTQQAHQCRYLSKAKPIRSPRRTDEVEQRPPLAGSPRESKRRKWNDTAHDAQESLEGVETTKQPPSKRTLIPPRRLRALNARADSLLFQRRRKFNNVADDFQESLEGLGTSERPPSKGPPIRLFLYGNKYETARDIMSEEHHRMNGRDGKITHTHSLIRELFSTSDGEDLIEDQESTNGHEFFPSLEGGYAPVSTATGTSFDETFDRFSNGNAKPDSLLAELFPNNKPKRPHWGGRFPIPRIHIPTEMIRRRIDKSRWYLPGQTRTLPPSEPPQDVHAYNEFDQQKLAILILESASQNLVEADFRSLIPRGQHIAEWPGGPDILKVIPLRNTWSLKKTGSYCIVFANEDSAKEYHAHAHKAFKLSTGNLLEASVGLLSPIPSPPGLEENGIDLHALRHSFTLAPTGNDFALKRQSRPYPSHVYNVLQNGGYCPIVDYQSRAPGTHGLNLSLESAQSATKVLLSLSGNSTLEQVGIKKAINTDGVGRGQLWNIADMHSLGGALAQARRVGYMSCDEVSYEAFCVETKNRWVLSFEDSVQARQFAYTWHGRELTFEESENFTHTDHIVTEVLW